VLSTAPTSKGNAPTDTTSMNAYRSNANSDISNGNTIIDGNNTINNSAPLRVPQVYRQYGGPKAWPHTSPRLELKNLIFSYPSVGSISKEGGYIKPILNNISFIIPPGGFSLGIVGPSGSGKSTILRVLLGLEPIRYIEGNNFKEATLLPNAAGSLNIDGMDVSGYDRIPCFALAGQDSDLFRGLSLVDNIRYGTHTLSDSFATDSLEAKVALDNAAEDAQLDPLLQRLQGGWDAAVGPRGRLLSGGERQRVCLARALYREELSGGILLMDEVTASLDAKTESLVTNAVSGRVKKGATAILIAHRLSSVQHCDMIIVMKDGEIIERGTHTQLIRKDGWYSESWKLQSQSR
jgi:ABC-type multidrug transport system fused ATPase/permease subunit